MYCLIEAFQGFSLAIVVISHCDYPRICHGWASGLDFINPYEPGADMADTRLSRWFVVPFYKEYYFNAERSAWKLPTN
jgi:hypothetical protein